MDYVAILEASSMQHLTSFTQSFLYLVHSTLEIKNNWEDVTEWSNSASEKLKASLPVASYLQSYPPSYLQSASTYMEIISALRSF